MKTKPFDLNAIKNGAKWGIFECNVFQTPCCADAWNHVELLFSETKMAIIYCGLNIVNDAGIFHGSIASVYQILLIEEPKLASDLSDLKVGDKVYDLVYGRGKIDHLSTLINVKFDYTGAIIQYNFNGIQYCSYQNYRCNQSLFLTEIKFEIPEV